MWFARDGRNRFSLHLQLYSSVPAAWGGIVLENYSVPALLIPRHEHPEHFLHLVLSGNVEYQIRTRGRDLRFTSRPGTLFLLPRGTVDEINWRGPTQRMIDCDRAPELRNPFELCLKFFLFLCANHIHSGEQACQVILTLDVGETITLQSVFMLETVTWASVITEPVGSVIVPKTVASWV